MKDKATSPDLEKLIGSITTHLNRMEGKVPSRWNCKVHSVDASCDSDRMKTYLIYTGNMPVLYGGKSRNDSPSLTVRFDEYKNRVHINGDFRGLTDWKGGYEGHVITVAPDKFPEAIAKDIIRRLLPDYEKDFAERAEKRAQREAYWNNATEVGTNMIQFCLDMGYDNTNYGKLPEGDPQPEYRFTPSKRDGRSRSLCEVRTHGDNVEIKVGDLSTTQAKFIISLLHDFRTTGQINERLLAAFHKLYPEA